MSCRHRVQVAVVDVEPELPGETGLLGRSVPEEISEVVEVF